MLQFLLLREASFFYREETALDLSGGDPSSFLLREEWGAQFFYREEVGAAGRGWIHLALCSWAGANCARNPYQLLTEFRSILYEILIKSLSNPHQILTKSLLNPKSLGQFFPVIKTCPGCFLPGNENWDQPETPPVFLVRSKFSLPERGIRAKPLQFFIKGRNYTIMFRRHLTVVSLCLSYGVPVVFQCFSYGFPMVFLCFLNGFPMHSLCSPMVFL